MIPEIFGSNRPMVITILLLPAIGLGFLAYYFGSFPEVISEGPLSGIFESLKGSRALSIILGITVNLAAGILLNIQFNAHSFAAKETFFAVLVYFAFSAVQLDYSFLNPVSLAVLFTLLGLRRLLRMYRVLDVTAMIFDAGIFFAIAMLLSPAFIMVVPLLWIALIQLRSFNLREWLVPLTGVLLPCLFIGMYYWWFDMQFPFDTYAIDFSGLSQISDGTGLYGYVFLVLTIFIVVAGAAIYGRDMQTSTVHKKNTKKVFVSLSVLLLLAFFVYFDPSRASAVLALILAAPVAVYGGVYFSSTRRRKLGAVIRFAWMGAVLAILIGTQLF